MLEIGELEKKIHAEIDTKLENISWSHIHFREGNRNSAEGTYVFLKKNNYHILSVEKGKIQRNVITNDEKEVLWIVLGEVVTNILLDYAMANARKGKDFRRAFFYKEIEIYSLFGEEFQNRKINEIENILDKNPYIDN